MFTADYEVLVRNRQAELLREAEQERRAAAVKPGRKARVSFRQRAARLGYALVKWGRKLEQSGSPGHVSA
jgi:hypothetical protein